MYMHISCKHNICNCCKIISDLPKWWCYLFYKQLIFRDSRVHIQLLVLLFQKYFSVFVCILKCLFYTEGIKLRFLFYFIFILLFLWFVAMKTFFAPSICIQGEKTKKKKEKWKAKKINTSAQSYNIPYVI